MSDGNLGVIPKNLRETIDFLAKRGELKTIDAAIDPVYEIAAIEKKLDNGPAFLFENIKGYPGVRDLGNLFARIERTSALFGVNGYRKFKYECLAAIKSPIPPKIVSGGPCQEVVIKDNIDVGAILPLIKHSEDDAGPMLGGGVVFAIDPKHNNTEVSFKRMYFRGKDWGTVNILPATHLGKIVDGKIVSDDSFAMSAHCNRVATLDGHLACVSVEFEAKPSKDEILKIWSNFKAYPQEKCLPLAPQQPVMYIDEPDRPQVNRDRDAGRGMAVTVGRLRDCPVFHYRFACLSHNTIRGAAGGGILIAEMLKEKGYL